MELSQVFCAAIGSVACSWPFCQYLGEEDFYQGNVARRVTTPAWRCTIQLDNPYVFFLDLAQNTFTFGESRKYWIGNLGFSIPQKQIVCLFVYFTTYVKCSFIEGKLIDRRHRYFQNGDVFWHKIQSAFSDQGPWDFVNICTVWNDLHLLSQNSPLTRLKSALRDSRSMLISPGFVEQTRKLYWRHLLIHSVALALKLYISSP